MKQMADLSEEVLAKNGLAELHAIVVDYINHNEKALALDLLCEYAIEHGIAITQRQFNLITEFANELSLGSIVISNRTISQLRRLSDL
jgi:hypothetical protein